MGTVFFAVHVSLLSPIISCISVAKVLIILLQVVLILSLNSFACNTSNSGFLLSNFIALKHYSIKYRFSLGYLGHLLTYSIANSTIVEISVVWPKYNDKHCNWLIQGVLVFCIEAGKLTCPLMRSNVAHKNKVRKILYNVVF